MGAVACARAFPSKLASLAFGLDGLGCVSRGNWPDSAVGRAAKDCAGSSCAGRLEPLLGSFETGGGGAGRTGIKLLVGTPGGFGAARFGTLLDREFALLGGRGFALDEERGIGGGALGFSKLPS